MGHFPNLVGNMVFFSWFPPQVVLLWMDKILHHLKELNHPKYAGFRPSTKLNGASKPVSVCLETVLTRAGCMRATPPLKQPRLAGHVDPGPD